MAAAARALKVVDKNTEADQAAAEAAREAKADVLEKAGKAGGETKPATKKELSAKGAAKAAAGPWKRFVVDVWITNFNSIEFGFYKNSRNRAKSRQFSSDMDIFAEIIEDGERVGLLGYREELWKKHTGTDKRLVFKLFNETLNWKATMDMMVGRGLQLTMGARGVPVLAFSVNVNDHDFMVYVERSAHKWPLMPENFSFFIIENGEPQFYRLRRAFINLGGDYTLYNQQNKVIGTIDGRLFSFGKWKGRVRTEHAE